MLARRSIRASRHPQTSNSPGTSESSCIFCVGSPSSRAPRKPISHLCSNLSCLNAPQSCLPKKSSNSRSSSPAAFRLASPFTATSLHSISCISSTTSRTNAALNYSSVATTRGKSGRHSSTICTPPSSPPPPGPWTSTSVLEDLRYQSTNPVTPILPTRQPAASTTPLPFLDVSPTLHSSQSHPTHSVFRLSDKPKLTNQRHSYSSVKTEYHTTETPLLEPLHPLPALRTPPVRKVTSNTTLSSIFMPTSDSLFLNTNTQIVTNCDTANVDTTNSITFATFNLDATPKTSLNSFACESIPQRPAAVFKTVSTQISNKHKTLTYRFDHPYTLSPYASTSSIIDTDPSHSKLSTCESQCLSTNTHLHPPTSVSPTSYSPVSDMNTNNENNEIAMLLNSLFPTSTLNPSTCNSSASSYSSSFYASGLSPQH
ncbi:unnamed protein product, partial [Protopolystoma xenopodis]